MTFCRTPEQKKTPTSTQSTIITVLNRSYKYKCHVHSLSLFFKHTISKHFKIRKKAVIEMLS